MQWYNFFSLEILELGVTYLLLPSDYPLWEVIILWKLFFFFKKYGFGEKKNWTDIFFFSKGNNKSLFHMFQNILSLLKGENFSRGGGGEIMHLYSMKIIISNVE